MVFLTALGLSSSAARAEYRQEITDALGRRVVMTVPPQRIVTVFSSNTELIAALGLTDYIVGIDAFTLDPPEIIDRPKVGGRLGISLEQVVAQKPDLVFLTPARQAVFNLVKPLEKMGIPTVVFTSRTVEEIKDNLIKAAIITGRPQAGQAVIEDMNVRFAQVRERRLGRQVPKVVLVTGRLPSGLLYTARKGGYTSNIVELAGGELALEKALGGLILSSPQISPEALMNVDPDIILYTRGYNEGPEMGEYLRREIFSTLKAHRQGHIYEVPNAEFLIPSPRVVGGVERLADIFERWDKQQ